MVLHDFCFPPADVCGALPRKAGATPAAAGRERFLHVSSVFSSWTSLGFCDEDDALRDAGSFERAPRDVAHFWNCGATRAPERAHRLVGTYCNSRLPAVVLPSARCASMLEDNVLDW